MKKRKIIISLLLLLLLIGCGNEKKVEEQKKTKDNETITKQETDEKCNENIYGGSYTLSFENYGDKKIDSISVCISCATDTYDDLPIPEKKDMIFDGWYYDKDFKEKVNVTSTKDIKIKQNIENNCIKGYQDITLYAKWKSIEKKIEEKKKEEKKIEYYCKDGSKPTNGKCTIVEEIKASETYYCDSPKVLKGSICYFDELPAVDATCADPEAKYNVIEDYCIKYTDDDETTCESKNGYMSGQKCRIETGGPVEFYCAGEREGMKIVEKGLCARVENAKIKYTCPNGYELNNNICKKYTTSNALTR